MEDVFSDFSFHVFEVAKSKENDKKISGCRA